MTALAVWLAFAGGYVLGAVSFVLVTWWFVRSVERGAKDVQKTKRGDKLLSENE